MLRSSICQDGSESRELVTIQEECSLHLFLSLKSFLSIMPGESFHPKGRVTSNKLGAGRLLKCWGIWDSTSVNSDTFLCQGTLLVIGANFRGDEMRK